VTSKFEYPKSFGRYKVLDLVARGGLAAIFKCEAPDGDLVAVKALLKEGGGINVTESQYPMLTTRFQREIQITGQLDHRAVVRLIDSGYEGDIPYMVINYVVGERLFERIYEGAPMEVEEARTLMIKVCDGLQMVHFKNIAHRDVQPKNLLLVIPDDDPVLIDFGLALTPHLSMEGKTERAGTVSYMPPEIVDRERFIPPGVMGNINREMELFRSADIWGIGCLFYFSLSGKRPFPGDTEEEVFKAITDSPHVPLSDIVPSIPEWPDKVLDYIFQKDYRQRPSTPLLTGTQFEDRGTTIPQPKKKLFGLF